jgi:hypothetical protein
MQARLDVIEALRRKEDGERLVSQLSIIERKAEPFLERIVQTFPEYTPHNVKHSERVVRILGWLIPEEIKICLNQFELYFLLSAAYLHDIGMVDLPELSHNKQSTSPEYIRDHHHARSDEFIREHFADLGIEDPHQALAIGRIARGHRNEDLHDAQLFRNDFVYKDKSINIPLMAAFLRIADELDLTSDRTPFVVYEHLPPKNPISIIEWQKHLQVSGVGPDANDPLMINCTAICKAAGIHRALKRLETKINAELDDLPYNLHQYRQERAHLPRKIVMKIESVGYKPYDFKFTLREKEIVHLLMGEKLYARKEEALRELLKNCVDACRYRRELMTKKGMKYSPQISFELSRNRDRLTVVDNGMGMDEDIIERYFTKIGESFYTSPEFLEKNLNITPVSELGIGFLSSFMLSEKVNIQTKTENGDPLEIEIDDISDFFVVSPGKPCETGTTVTLMLKEEVRDKLDLEKEIRYFARHLEIPVNVVVDGKTVTIEESSFESYLAGVRSATRAFHVMTIDTDYVTGMMALTLAKDEELGFRPANWRAAIHYSNQPHFFISNEGILVSHDEYILPRYLDEAYWYVDLDLRGGSLDLNAARNAIVTNVKFSEFVKSLELQLISGLEEFLIILEQRSKKANIATSELVNSFFREYTPLYRYRGKKEEAEELKEFLNLARKFYYFKCFTKGGEMTYRRYENVSNEKLSPVYVHVVGLMDDGQISELVKGCAGFTKDHIYVFVTIFDSALVEYLTTAPPLPFGSFLEIAKVKPHNLPIPKTWRIVRFLNYHTERILEFEVYPGAYLNADNRFMHLLLGNEQIITKDRKLAVEGFFRTLRHAAKRSMKEVAQPKRDFKLVR